MRNVVIFLDNGDCIPYTDDYNINPKVKKFTKTIFKENGQILCLPFVNTFRELFYRIDPNSQNLAQLNSINDDNKIWMIFNQITNNPKDWQRNRFLSELFNCDIYAENKCMFVSEDELNNGKINVTDEEFENFKDSVIKICSIIFNRKSSEYFDSINIFLHNDEILELDNEIVTDFQDEYIGKRMELKFSEVIELNNNDVIIRKNGVILYSHDNACEMYFCPIYKSNDDLNVFKEILC